VLQIAFIFLVLYTLYFFYQSNNGAWKLTLILLLWSGLHSVLAYNGFYENTTALPPRFVFLLPPLVLAIIYGLRPKQRQWIIQNRNLKTSTLLHTVRGRNFDILAGLTAPIMAWLLWKKKLSLRTLYVWNIICLCLVLLIAANGLLSAPLPFQQFAFDQPNIALLKFPYILLPGLIVPVVVYTHLSDLVKIRHLMKNKMS